MRLPPLQLTQVEIGISAGVGPPSPLSNSLGDTPEDMDEVLAEIATL